MFYFREDVFFCASVSFFSLSNSYFLFDVLEVLFDLIGRYLILISDSSRRETDSGVNK